MLADDAGDRIVAMLHKAADMAKEYCAQLRHRHVSFPKCLSEEFLKSYESFVIQEWWPDSRRGHRCGRAKNRGRYDRSKLRYPSDLTDDEWALIEPLIPPARRGGNKRTLTCAK